MKVLMYVVGNLEVDIKQIWNREQCTLTEACRTRALLFLFN